jgi:GNAT superfamily N-acetyltransferase
VIVREAVFGDIPRLIEMGERVHVESVVRFPPISVARAEAGFARLIDSDLACLLVAQDTQIIGMLSGFMSAYFFSEAQIALQDIFYVEPEYRKTGAGRALVGEFADWALRKGAWEARIHTNTGIDTQGTERFFESMDFERTGSLWRKKL